MRGERPICVLVGLVLIAAGISAWRTGDRWLGASLFAAAAFVIGTPFVPASWRA